MAVLGAIPPELNGPRKLSSWKCLTSQMKRPSRKVSEADKVKMLLGNFVAKGSNGEKLLNTLFGDNQSLKRVKKAIFAACDIFAAVLGIKSLRYERRNRDLCVKFFDDHYDQILAITTQYKFMFGSFVRQLTAQFGSSDCLDNITCDLTDMPTDNPDFDQFD